MISNYINRHEAFLKQVIADSSVPARKIHAAIDYSLFPGGKRIRPVLVYLAGSLLDLDPDILDAIAAAVELTHCYSLIHDDLPAMDNDDFRRGRASCHKAFDEATAILAGDGMQALAIDVLLTYLPGLVQAKAIIAITRQLIQATGISGMVSGQSLDLSELASSSIDDERLKEIHYLKTGRLILACIEMVLCVQPTTPIYQTALQTYARHIGLVFQMQDDYLDVYAPAEFLGKGRSSDLANQKTTFASLYSKDKLAQEISKRYQIALDALDVFGPKAQLLVELTKELQQRSNLF